MSLQRSGRGSRTTAAAPRGGGRAAGGRPAGGRAGIYVPSPKSDIYVALLGVALGAMILGCIFLLLVWGRYGYSTKPTAMAPTPTLARLA